ncbi:MULTISPECIES: hypothetical protein [Malaciobacter]|uniref:Uncharacterized protein n=2 Tax=Malaciobacter TaxID=2321114 RepID=A0AB36ZT43_9BACT|nr:MULTISPECIES: hypothetical protein [Malaciobacter]PHO10206.1 hypothetical protein CPG37_05915 [Malaciobacter canalis]PPK59864.1 hypothetical protein B0F89_13020 [Malaciobacter marinus]QEE32696.1 hypothetical protein ACAN_1211 [Malaciobacter canalis]SKB29002.1 hypothetical protein SAMN06295997_103142 [Malaciobacter marinus]
MTTKIKELKDLLEDDALLELDETIIEVSKNIKNDEDKEELQYLKDLKKYFEETLRAIAKDELTQEQAVEILAVLEEMQLHEEDI